MQKKLMSMLVLFLIAVLAVGCNTEDTTEKSDVTQNDPSTTTKQTPAETEEEDVQETPESPTEPTSTTPAAQQEQDVTYVQKGVDKTVKATASESVDQLYKIHQLPGFTLSQEEPGKDILVSNDDDEVSMRIETVSTSEATYDNVKTSLQEYMTIIGDTAPLSAEELAVFKDVQNIESYVVNSDTEKVIGIVFEKDELIAKLIIYDNKQQDLTAAMLAMAATITKK